MLNGKTSDKLQVFATAGSFDCDSHGIAWTGIVATQQFCRRKSRFGVTVDRTMERLAEALIRATHYINDRTVDCTEDDDVKQLEDVAYLVGQCTNDEKRVLIKMAKEIGLPKWPQEMGILE